VIQRSVPTRTLSDRPHLDQLKRQAKDLLEAFRERSAGAAEEVRAHYRDADPASFALHDAQLVLARAYGFDSWPKLKAFVDGVTVRRLIDAVQAGDLEAVRSMVTARPELVHLDLAENDEHRALHHAVLQRRPEIVRFLMQQGADARKGIWPHRGATTAFTLAAERGYDEIVRIIEEEEQRRAEAPPLATLPPPVAARLVYAFQRGDEHGMIEALEAHPQLIRTADPAGRTPLHWAAARLWPTLAAWLLKRGADPAAPAKDGATPLDMVGKQADSPPPAEQPAAVRSMADLLLGRGAAKTAHAAVATGDRDWLEARHRDGLITNGHGLVSRAVTVNRPDMLAMLLQMGLDPDEAGRVQGLEEVVPTWGEPLRACAIARNVAMAEMLLTHGARPNTNVYAASDALYEAYKRRDQEMIALLERHGARLTPIPVAELGLVDRAAGLLAEAVAAAKDKVAQDLLWGAIESPSPEIVKLALEAVDWAPEDARWHGILENGLYLGPDSDRRRHLEAFRPVLDRSDPSIRSRRGTTLLHEVAASRGGLTAGDRTAYTTLLLDRGARLDLRDELLQSTPLGWACRWGRPEMVKLLLERGADPIESSAPPWATPTAWATRMQHSEVVSLLQAARPA
jgi:ankyrin repeat protein